jgi:hypothetical protein
MIQFVVRHCGEFVPEEARFVRLSLTDARATRRCDPE